jgi:5-formyltetrahydrofolate cyclo-ligase
VSAAENKNQLRERILKLLKEQHSERRFAKSVDICHKLFLLDEIQNARTIMFYASFDGEVDTFEMMKQARQLGKKIALPKIVRDRNMLLPALVPLLDKLENGPFGIKQPPLDAPAVALDDLDAVVVPGVAFDRHSNRLGRGGGYYDRFMQSLPSHVPTIGLAFDFQIVEQIPSLEAHDRPVSVVLAN